MQVPIPLQYAWRDAFSYLQGWMKPELWGIFSHEDPRPCNVTQLYRASTKLNSWINHTQEPKLLLSSQADREPGNSFNWSTFPDGLKSCTYGYFSLMLTLALTSDYWIVLDLHMNSVTSDTSH